MALSQTERLLLACAATKADTAKIKNILCQGINWEYLINLARAHKIEPLVYNNLKEQEIPPDIKAQLKKLYQDNLFYNLRLQAEQNKIFKLLDDNNIDYVPLKGTVLAEEVFGDIALRKTGDIDLLAKEKDLPKIKELLINFEYLYQEAWPSGYTTRTCHLVFRKKYGVEVHWNIGPINKLRVCPDILWEEVRGNREKKFSPEMLLVFAILKFNFESFSTLKYLIDIAEIIQRHEKGINWLEVEKLLKTYRQINVFFLSLTLIRELLNIPPLPGTEAISRPSWLKKTLIKKFPREKFVIFPGYKRFWRLMLMDTLTDQLLAVSFYCLKTARLV